MTHFWHPLSTLYMPQPRCYASSAMIRMMLAGEGAADLIYGGDRMWPAVAHGQEVRLRPHDGSAVAAGEALVVEHRRIPDLLRVVQARAGGRVLLRGDSDPLNTIEIEGGAILGRAELGVASVSQLRRRSRRARLEILEALSRSPDDAEEDPAQTVRRKYDAQAPFYGASEREDISGTLLQRIGSAIPPGGRVVVVGSGSGGECFALHRAGFRVRGIDFSAAMTAVAREGAEQRRLDIEFVEADIREHSEEAATLSGILFTYESYSFLPQSTSRVALLRRMARWIAPDGAIFLSARMVEGLHQRSILTIQRLRAGAWGDSHTRYLLPDGALRRSFVHYFTMRGLRREAAAAGLSFRSLSEGSFELRRKSGHEAA